MYCALAFASPAILLPFFSLLSYNKTNASFAQQPSSLPSILFTPHSPVLPKRPKRAPKSSPDAWVFLRFGTCTLFRQMGKSMRRHVYVSACFYTVKHTRVRTSLAARHQIGPAGCERSSANTVIHTYMLCIQTEAQNKKQKKGKKNSAPRPLPGEEGPHARRKGASGSG